MASGLVVHEVETEAVVVDVVVRHTVEVHGDKLVAVVGEMEVGFVGNLGTFDSFYLLNTATQQILWTIFPKTWPWLRSQHLRLSWP